MGEYIDYNNDVQAIKEAILFSQHEAALDGNAIQLRLYYAVGGYVSVNTREGKWGTGAIDSISKQLKRELPGLRGFSATNLRNMRLFYEAWKSAFKETDNLSVATDESSRHEQSVQIRQLQLTNLDRSVNEDFFSIGFTHHCVILSKAKEMNERLFYIQRCAREHMSVDMLKRSIRNDDYRHRGALPNSQRALRAIETFKDEYFLDFVNTEELGVRDAADVDERVVEQAIIHNVKNFIMEFGQGFSFVGNAYHVDAFGVDQFIDLLFFNRNLNCLVAVELKRGKFKTAYLGQLSGYLSVLDEFERKPHENPSIGIVLCKDMNDTFVNLVIRNYNIPMGVATYATPDNMPKDLREALPNIEDLKALLENQTD